MVSVITLLFGLPIHVEGSALVSPFTLRDTLESIICYSHTLDDNLGIKENLTTYLEESCYLASDQHFSFKCFPENASVG